MKKRILSIVSLVLVCLMLVACGSSSSTDTATEATAAPAADTATDTADVATETDWPERPITIVIAASAGGDTDLNTRIFAKYLEEELGQTIVISNISGISVGLGEVKNAVADGYTLGSYHTGFMTSTIFGTIDYAFDDLTFFNIFVNDTQSGWFVAADAPYQTLDELAAYAAENTVSFATEVGSVSHLTGVHFTDLVGDITINPVDAGGAADKIVALMGGQLNIMYNQVGLVSDYLENGDFVCIGIMSDERSEANPDIPTFKEQGYDMNYDKPYFLFGPAGLDQAIIDKMNEAIVNVCANEEYAAELLETMQTVPGSWTSEEALALLQGVSDDYEVLISNYMANQ